MSSVRHRVPEPSGTYVVEGRGTIMSWPVEHLRGVRVGDELKLPGDAGAVYLILGVASGCQASGDLDLLVKEVPACPS